VPKTRLSKYDSKRNFKVTTEPKPNLAGEGRLYVVQRHDATRLHFDLRLQHAGVLLSWAVPKEPTMEPAVKRLAVRVEDHPVEYGDFEGTIPKGNYGAGEVEIWDRGTWTPHGDVDKSLSDGNLKFKIEGEKLKGEFDLVRMGKPSEKENWLLIKRKVDAESLRIDFMLCQKKEKPPRGSQFTCEIKWDGYRVFASRSGKKITIITRGKNEISLPHIESKLLKLLPDGATIDGEIVVFDDNGKSSFHRLQQLLGEKDESICFVGFDILHDGEKDMRPEPIEDRRKRLKEILGKDTDIVRTSIEIPGSPKDALAACCMLGYEGIICKKKGSTYHPGRSSDWIKVKCDNDQTFKIIGFTNLADHDSAIGALVVAEETDEGLRYSGRVGTGFSQNEREELFTRLAPLKQDSSAVKIQNSKDKRGVVWVEPTTEVRVKYLEKTENGIVRQARYDGIAEQSAPILTKPVAFKVSSGDRVIDKTSGITKQDIANYYSQHLNLVYPYLENRAVSLIRCPEGVDGECFFQRNPPRHHIEGSGAIEVGGHTYLVIETPEAILNSVQYGTIEFHPWGSHAATPAIADILVFDLDPGESVSWDELKDAAQLIRTELESLGLVCFPRLSGSKGIHLFVPIKPELEWPEIKAFVKAFSESCAVKSPNLITEIAKAQRKGKIFLDYLRNSQHATAVASFSLRAKPGLPIACPLTWEGLAKSTASNQFTIKNIGEVITTDPWGNWKASAKSLKKILGI